MFCNEAFGLMKEGYMNAHLTLMDVPLHLLIIIMKKKGACKKV